MMLHHHHVSFCLDFTEVLFGVPWKDSGITRLYFRNRQRIITYAFTIAYKKYNPRYCLCCNSCPNHCSSLLCIALWGRMISLCLKKNLFIRLNLHINRYELRISFSCCLSSNWMFILLLYE